MQISSDASQRLLNLTGAWGNANDPTVQGTQLDYFTEGQFWQIRTGLERMQQFNPAAYGLLLRIESDRKDNENMSEAEQAALDEALAVSGLRDSWMSAQRPILSVDQWLREPERKPWDVPDYLDDNGDDDADDPLGLEERLREVEARRVRETQLAQAFRNKKHEKRQAKHKREMDEILDLNPATPELEVLPEPAPQPRH